MVDAVAKDFGLTVGSQVTLQTPGGTPTTLTVGALQKQVPGGTSMGRDRFAPTVGIDLLTRLAPAAADTRLFVSAARGADPEKVGSALKSALAGYPQVAVQDRTALKAFERHESSGVLALVYGLLALAIVIAVLGVINTLALSVTERTREIGLLRAIGTSRDQVSHMIQLESVLIAVFGAVLGLVLGLAWGVAFHYSAGASQSVLAIPWLTLGATIVAAAAAGIAAALLPAVRATRIDILDAIATT
jgi:putative ABC transport system permease protein